MVNHYYCYGVDEDFGPFFLKFCSYFPYNGKLCINGHEYLKRQLHKRRLAFEPLDNGILSCKDPAHLQRLTDTFTAERIDALLRKWLRHLPHPFTAKDRQADYRYRLSILQAEFSLTQVLDRAISGRVFFKQVIRENLDLGRPDQVQRPTQPLGWVGLLQFSAALQGQMQRQLPDLQPLGKPMGVFPENSLIFSIATFTTYRERESHLWARNPHLWGRAHPIRVRLHLKGGGVPHGGRAPTRGWVGRHCFPHGFSPRMQRQIRDLHRQEPLCGIWLEKVLIFQ